METKKKKKKNEKKENEEGSDQKKADNKKDKKKDKKEKVNTESAIVQNVYLLGKKWKRVSDSCLSIQILHEFCDPCHIMYAMLLS